MLHCVRWTIRAVSKWVFGKLTGRTINFGVARSSEECPSPRHTPKYGSRNESERYKRISTSVEFTFECDKDSSRITFAGRAGQGDHRIGRFCPFCRGGERGAFFNLFLGAINQPQLRQRTALATTRFPASCSSRKASAGADSSPAKPFCSRRRRPVNLCNSAPFSSRQKFRPAKILFYFLFGPSPSEKDHILAESRLSNHLRTKSYLKSDTCPRRMAGLSSEKRHGNGLRV